MEPFEYTHTEVGHALQKMVVEKKLAAALKKHCNAHKCQPIACSMAHYAFTPLVATFHHVIIDVAAGKGDARAWLKNQSLPWKLGAFNDEAHEAVG